MAKPQVLRLPPRQVLRPHSRSARPPATFSQSTAQVRAIRRALPMRIPRPYPRPFAFFASARLQRGRPHEQQACRQTWAAPLYRGTLLRPAFADPSSTRRSLAFSKWLCDLLGDLGGVLRRCRVPHSTLPFPPPRYPIERSEARRAA